jgi:hypothetical protein
MVVDEKEPNHERKSMPPGHFVSDDLRQQTARFIDQLKKRLSREKPDSGPKLGPPPEQPPDRGI